MRVYLGGLGDPIPLEALPGLTVSDDLRPLAFSFASDAEFSKADYVNLGYTNFEAWCIGAVGGRGGMIPGSNDGIYPRNWSYGGGGGGGGLHHMAGLLEDLDDVTDIVVGLAGVDGAQGNGQTKFMLATSFGLPGEPTPNENLAIVDSGARPLTRGGHTYINADGSMVAPYVMVDNLGNIVASNNPARVMYVMYPNTGYVAPQDASDGGYSAFGDICKASGGKGGKKTPIYAVYNEQYGGIQNQLGGLGGDGGVGGRIAAGGGAAGSISGANGTDGSWDGVVGQGGGGGRGGTFVPETHPSVGAPTSARLFSASDGGRGSYSFGDTSVSGDRQNKQIDPDKTQFIVPGSGGGAKINSLLLYGSRAPRYNPNGVVYLRIFKAAI